MPRSPRHLSLVSLIALVALGLAPGALEADGFIFVPEPPPHFRPVHPHPRRIIPPRPHFPLEVTKHRVRVEIEDNVAHTVVEETFHNRNDLVLEGVYIFPLPPGAAVSSFKMKMGDKMVEGEVLEADKARSIYQDIVRKMRDPGLLEYVDRGLFRASVFPIPARGDVEVAIEYSESLSRDAGLSVYRYPLDTGKYSAGEYQNVVIDVRLRSREPIHSVNTPGYETSIDRHGEKEVRIGFEAKRLDATKDLIVQWNVGEDAIAPLLLTHRGSEHGFDGRGDSRDGFFLLSIAPRPEEPDKAPPKDLVLAIDTSGSMMTGSKLEHVKKALRYAIDGLNEGDRFQIIDFSTEARRFRPGLVEATEENRAAAREHVDRLEARGGTNIEEALRFAFESDGDGERAEPGERPHREKPRPRYVVLLTDGEPTIGITRPEDLLESVRKRNEGRFRIFALGVGEDLNAKLLDLLVAQNKGVARYLRGDENLELALSSFHDKIDSPVLTDVTIEFRGGDGEVSSLYPKPLPDVFRGDQLDIFGRYRGEGFRTVVLKGSFLGEPRVFEYSLEFGGGDHPEIPRLWALRAIGHLLEEMRLHGEKSELRDEVIRLSKRYGIITPYTSYLILEDDRRLTSTRGNEEGRFRRAASESLRQGYALGGDDAPRGAPTAEPAARDASDRALAKRAAESAERFSASSGAGAVASSRELDRLKRGEELGQAQFEGLAETTDGEASSLRGALAIAVKHVGGKTFYLQGDRWIDSLLTTTEKDLDESSLRRVVYLSEEYFDLLDEDADVAKWLSVGPNVTFVHKGKVVSIVES